MIDPKRYPPRRWFLYSSATLLVILSLSIILAALLLMRRGFVMRQGIVNGSSMEPIMRGPRLKVPCERCDQVTEFHWDTCFANRPFACPKCGVADMFPGLDVSQIDSQDERLVDGDQVTIAPLRLVKNSRAHLQNGQSGISLAGLKRGDVIVLQVAVGIQREIKRLVGLPGESVRISDGDLFIDNERLVKDYHQALRQSVLLDAWDVSDVQSASRWHHDGSAFNGVLAARNSSEIGDEGVQGGAPDVAEKIRWIPYRALHSSGRYIDNALDGNAHDSHQRIEVQDIGLAMQLSPAESNWGIVFCLNTPRTKTRVLVTNLEGQLSVDGVPVEMGAKDARSGTSVEWIVVMQVDSELVVGDGRQEWYRRPLESKDRRGDNEESDDSSSEIAPIELKASQGEVQVRSLIVFRDIHYRGNRDAPEQEWAASNSVIVLGDNVSASSDSRDRWETGLPESSIKGVVLPVGSGLESLLRQRRSPR